MANGQQMKLAIDAASKRVAEHGYASDDVTTKDVLLAGLGYVAETVDRRTTLIRVEGKTFFWAGLGLSVVNLVWGAVFTLIKVV